MVEYVYDKLFEEDIVIKNEVTRLFEEGYSKYDSTIKMLNGIEKSPDNYNLRDIEIVKSDIYFTMITLMEI